MEPGQESYGLFFVLGGCCYFREDMGQTVHDKRHEDMNLQNYVAEYERVRIASYEKRAFELDGIRYMVRTTLYTVHRQPFMSFKPQAGRRLWDRHVCGRAQQYRRAL